MYTYQVKSPIALFLFKRENTIVQIMKQIEKVSPQKIYLLSDQGRTEEEKQKVRKVRETVEKAITWPCEVIKLYAETNRGVYRNIGIGAQQVFEKEDQAIFLEDDNYPEITFFQYADELLDKYRHDEKVLWICGTNYLHKYINQRNESYFFTQHLLPCGWASWKTKYLKYYNGELDNLLDGKDNFFETYDSKALAKQQWTSITREYSRKINGRHFISWDYQMLFSLRSNGLYGIAPCYNQIRNIGADDESTHGGTSLSKIMTKRFCEIPTLPLSFPLIHPEGHIVDSGFNKRIGKVILLPMPIRMKNQFFAYLKKRLGIQPDQHLKKELMRIVLRR